MARVFVGLGANLGDPKAQFAAALEAMKSLGAVRRRARLYGSLPWGPPGQPDYLNTVAELETALDPHTLLLGLQAVERHAGRQRSVHWGPRTLDLDLLLYGAVQLETAQLTVPHPGVASRPFVLAPLLDLAPELELPGGRALSQYWHSLEVPTNSLWVVENAVVCFSPP